MSCLDAEGCALPGSQQESTALFWEEGCLEVRLALEGQ